MTVVIPERGKNKPNDVMLDSKSVMLQKLESHESSLGSLGWTEQEDRRLVELHRKYGNRWALIKKFMGGKTGQQCLKRWRYTLDPTVRKDSWTKEETERLMKLHEELGSKWSDIARKLGTGRTDIQCRYRFFRVISGKAANTVSRDTTRFNRTYSACDSNTFDEEIGGKNLESPSSVQRRSSDPGSIGTVIRFGQSENSCYPAKAEVSYSFSSRTSDGACFGGDRCPQHLHGDFVNHQQNGTIEAPTKDNFPSSVCPDCGIARVRPLHNVSSSRVVESKMAYQSPNACVFSDQEKWVALDSMMGLPRCFDPYECSGSFQSTKSPVFRDRRSNEEASFNSLMGVSSTISKPSKTEIPLKGNSYNILPPLYMNRMNNFGSIDGSAMMESCNLPPLRE